MILMHRSLMLHCTAASCSLTHPFYSAPNRLFDLTQAATASAMCRPRQASTASPAAHGCQRCADWRSAWCTSFVTLMTSWCENVSHIHRCHDICHVPNCLPQTDLLNHAGVVLGPAVREGGWRSDAPQVREHRAFAGGPLPAADLLQRLRQSGAECCDAQLPAPPRAAELSS